MKIKDIISSNPLNYFICTLFMCGATETLRADEYSGALNYYYFDRQPSAQAEAMGRSSVAYQLPQTVISPKDPPPHRHYERERMYRYG